MFFRQLEKLCKAVKHYVSLYSVVRTYFRISDIWNRSFIYVLETNRVQFTTRVRHECNTSATRVLHERHECNTSEKSKPSKGFQSTNGKILYPFCFIACKQFCVICIVSETTVLIFQEKFTYEDVKQEGS